MSSNREKIVFDSRNRTTTVQLGKLGGCPGDCIELTTQCQTLGNHFPLQGDSTGHLVGGDMFPVVVSLGLTADRLVWIYK